MVGWMDEWNGMGWMGGLMGGLMVGWIDGWMGGWVDGWTISLASIYLGLVCVLQQFSL